MKKKLYTAVIALGLTASASATSLSDAVYTVSDTTTSSDTIDVSSTGVSGSFTLTFTLDASQLAGLIGSTAETTDNLTLLASITGNASGRIIGASIGSPSNNTSNSGTFLAASQASAGATVAQASRWSTDGTSKLTTVDFTGAMSAAVTLIHTDTTSTTIVFTYTLADGTTYTGSGTSTSVKYSAGMGTLQTLGINTDIVSSAYLFSGTTTVDDAASLNTAAIAALVPEPATATLGLLALGALALRRRRA
ncbi:MAG: PEP-CTERM sorting domain-containing protein [Akkermansia sp.]|nr:PEP-CTERM sorting domain-containing protein [Akkermansia sp.]